MTARGGVRPVVLILVTVAVLTAFGQSRVSSSASAQALIPAGNDTLSGINIREAAAGSMPESAALTDFDGDGMTDLALEVSAE